ncbi:S1 family peptidase [Dongia sp.]|uniref:S1 family peptidase n=1 Tax=Dongia sp. TaxID=1977262 RepID=UPI0037501507
MSTPERTTRIRTPATAFAASLAVLLLVAAAASPAGAIINGKPMTGSEDYAHAVVGVVPYDEYDHPGACTGILIAPRAVLTAAHCVSGEDVKHVDVVFALTLAAPQKVMTTKAVIHPNYKSNGHKFSIGDIAIIFLAQHDYPTVIIPLDSSEDFTDGQQFVFAGYGRSIAHRSRSIGTARKASIAATGENTSQTVILKPLAAAWICDGDSGGPIMRKDMSGRYFLTGIMNAVPPGPVGECLFENSIMAPVHYYRDWIAETLAKGG